MRACSKRSSAPPQESTGSLPGSRKIAAQLHHTIALAMDLRTDYPDARQEYDRAEALFSQSEGALSQDAIIVELQRAALEARSYQAGTLDSAKLILSAEEAKIAKLPAPTGGPAGVVVQRARNNCLDRQQCPDS